MFKHIKTRVLFYIIPVTLLAILCSYFVSTINAQKLVREQIKEKMMFAQQAQASSITSIINDVTSTNEQLAFFVEDNYARKDITILESMLNSISKSNDNIHGTGIWFEPNVFDANKKYVGPYSVSEENSSHIIYDYSSQAYDYFSKPFYFLPKIAKETVYTNIYFDEYSQKYLMTCATPIYDEDNNFIGVVSSDITMSKGQDVIKKYNTEQSKFFILDKDGTYIGSTNQSLVKNQVSILTDDNSEKIEAVRVILDNEQGFVSFKENNEKYLMYYNTVPDVQFKLITVIPESIIKNPMSDLIVYYALITALSVVILILVIIFAMNVSIEKLINALVNEFVKIANNTYDNEIPHELLNRKDEIGNLGSSLGNMKTKLRKFQNELERLLLENQSYLIEMELHNDLLQTSELSLTAAVNYSEAIIKAIPEFVFIVNSEGLCIDCQGSNQKNLRTSKYFVGKHISELIPEEYVESVVKIINDAIEKNDFGQFSLNYESDGVQKYFDMRVAGFMEDQAVLIASDVTDYNEHINKIEYLSYNDQVTGLHNRRYFEESLKKYIDEKMFPLSVVISDLNGLKLINDSFGHDEGDILLKKFAKVLRNSDIPNGCISRVGGDEFTILLPKTELEDAQQMVDKIIQDCSKENVKNIALSVSFGVDTMVSENDSIDQVIKNAEDIMYQNKLYLATSRRDRTIELVTSTLQEKNPSAQMHSKRVSEFCKIMAEKLDMNKVQIGKIESAGLLHDIGKIGISEDILNKASSLTEEEFKEVKKHPEIGFRILQSAGNMKEIADIVLAHHERWDGQGYPKQLKGEEIPIEARIVAIADTYDAIINDRNYHEKEDIEYAIEELKKCSGKQFDPDLVDIFIKEVIQK